MTKSILQSMTGYADASGRHEDMDWQWQIRSVNGKGLDVRLRTPHGFDAIEADVRKQISSRFKRGNLQVSLAIDREKGASVPTINQAALDAVLVAAEHVAGRINSQVQSVESLLSLRGVLEISEPKISDDEQALLNKAVMDGLGEVLDGLQVSRSREGSALDQILGDNLDRIDALTKQAEDNPSRSVEAIQARLAEQVALLLQASSSLDQDRLHQEAAFLATKADIREEIDRLFAHVEAARELLAGGGPVGRKLEFLAQEFNRESNTLCSKSNAREVTATGLELKVVIDQFREQILNLE